VTPPPAAPQSPSSNLPGAGNPKQKPPCKRGFVRKKGKCVKKKSGKKGSKGKKKSSKGKHGKWGQR
jgi:hypothetical protein